MGAIQVGTQLFTSQPALAAASRCYGACPPPIPPRALVASSGSVTCPAIHSSAMPPESSREPLEGAWRGILPATPLPVSATREGSRGKSLRLAQGHLFSPCVGRGFQQPRHCGASKESAQAASATSAAIAALIHHPHHG